MRIILLTFLFVVSVTATAQARLGETPDQLVARYGQPLQENDQKAEGDKVAASYVGFQKGGFYINVTISDGISVKERFSKVNHEALTLSETRTLLDANSQGHEWEAPETNGNQKKWIRDDGAVAALNQGFLTITTKELIAKETIAKKLEAKPSLDGF